VYGETGEQGVELGTLSLGQTCQPLLLELLDDRVAMGEQGTAMRRQVERMAATVSCVGTTADRAEGFQVVHDRDDPAAGQP